MAEGYIPTVKNLEEAKANIRRVVNTPRYSAQVGRLTDALEDQSLAFRKTLIEIHRAEITSRECHIKELSNEIEAHHRAIADIEAQ